jgi:hypothetical protein
MDLGEGIHDALPVASGPPADEAVVAGRVRPKALGQIAPRCAGVQIGAAFDPQSAPKIFGAATLCQPETADRDRQFRRSHPGRPHLHRADQRAFLFD